MVAPPPLIYAGAPAAGLLASRLRPVSLPPRLPPGRSPGWPLIVGGLLFGMWGLWSLRRTGTTVDPYRPTTAFVSEGPYRFSRNPLYVGMTAIYLGISALASSPWTMLLLPGVLAVVQRGVIEREERYLEARFGDEYRRYRERVRRWI